MKALDTTLKANVSGAGSTLARLVEFTLLNGSVIYLTDNDRDIVWGGNTYKAAYGCTVSQVQIVLGIKAQSCTVQVLIDPAGISTAMIENGSLDGAKFVVRAVDFSAPTLPSVVFYVGFVSKVSYKDRLTASIDGQPLSSRSKPLATAKCSSNCRADLGDDQCKVNLEALKVTGITVAAVYNPQKLNGSYHAGTWANGLIVFTSGVNNGYSFEIASIVPTGDITLKGLMPFPASVGDTFTLYPGCDKTPANCKLYNNIVNFDGEPFTVAPYTATSPVTSAPATVSTTAAPAASPTGDATPSTDTIQSVIASLHQGIYVNGA